MPHCCIVVEGDLSDIMGKRYRSGAHPNSVLGATLSLMIDHKIPVCFCSDRQLARTFTEMYLKRVYRRLTSDTT
jgi:ERCC4-type nuclease